VEGEAEADRLHLLVMAAEAEHQCLEMVKRAML